MRLLLLPLLPFAALVTGGAASQHEPAPFDGAWMACETYQGANICAYTLMEQRGDRVCGCRDDLQPADHRDRDPIRPDAHLTGS